MRVHHFAVFMAAVAAFVFSSVYYGALGQEVMKLRAASAGVSDAASPPAWKLLVEVLRTLAVAYVLALLVGRLGIGGWRDALELALLLWIAFSLVMWVGAVIWENVPARLAAIHAGDWLAKVVLIAVIVGAWRS